MPQLHAEFEARWGVPWREAFGMTETGVDLAVQNEGGAQTQQTFNVSWRISAAVPDVRVIEVNVTWTEGDVGAGFPRSFLLASNKNNKPKAS